MDEIDYAQERQDAELRRLITAQVYALPRGESARECLECGEPIPEEDLPVVEDEDKVRKVVGLG